MLTDRQLLGLQGERVAARWLRQRGWTILDHRFRSGHRDIDLVAARTESPSDGRLVAFVEVRTRTSAIFGTPAESVQYRKQLELMRSARHWMTLNKRSNDNFRFDIVGVVLKGQNVRIQYIPDAFRRGWFG